MKYALTGLAGLIALGLVGLAPDTASAGYRGWGGPGFGIYVGPRYGYRSYGYGYGYRPYYYNRYSYGYGPRWRYRHRDWD